LTLQRSEGKHRLPEKLYAAMSAFKQPLIKTDLLLRAEKTVLNTTGSTFNFTEYDHDGKASDISIDKGEFISEIRAVRVKLMQQRYSNKTNRYFGWYSCASAGRFYGCFQNKHRYIKQLLYNDYYNYDLKNAHIVIFRRFCQRYNVKTPNFDQYFKDPQFKQNKADELYISVDGWKQLVFATVYGSTLSTVDQNAFNQNSSDHDQKKKFKKPAVVLIASDEMGGSYDFFDEYMPNSNMEPEDFIKYNTMLRDTLQNAMRPFQNEVKALEKAIGNEENLGKIIETNNVTKKRFIRNDCDRLFYIEKEGVTKKGNLKSKKKSLLLSHIVMGIEANFIHTLTNNIIKYEPENEVIANEHDGIIVKNQLKQNTIDQTIADTGYDYLELKEKPLYEHKLGLISNITSQYQTGEPCI